MFELCNNGLSKNDQEGSKARMEPKFIVVDEYGDSLRAFFSRESAEAFVKVRPECKVEDIPVLTDEEFDELYGLPPF